MRASLFVFFVFLSASAFAARPNIILCMADDLGWGDVGFNGNDVVLTPELDRMAKAGMRFERFYAAAPVCSPTRGSVLTGRHPHRYGIPTANKGHLKRDEITIAEVLKDQGYATGHFGKWHLGTLAPDYSGKKGRDPEKNHLTPGMSGFDEWFSTEYSVCTWDPYDPKNAHNGITDPRVLFFHNGRNIVDGPADGLVGDTARMVMDKALPFIEKASKAEQPFFTVIWFHAPHEPVVGGPEFLAMYPGLDENTQHYYAVITAVDRQMGRLRDSLQEWGVANDTMLWFTADNGPEGNPGKKGRSQGTADPFRGRKRSLYEGGVRVPGLLEWPGKAKAGRDTSVASVTSDYFATVLDVLGYKLPVEDRRPYDGISLLPLIEGKVSKRSAPIGFQGHGLATLNDNRFKLVHNPGKKRLKSDNGTAPISEWELYDLKNDQGETTNVIDKHSKIASRMRVQLEEWQASCEASSNGADY
jgi:arylsulfatase A-like enzyme